MGMTEDHGKDLTDFWIYNEGSMASSEMMALMVMISPRVIRSGTRIRASPIGAIVSRSRSG